MSPNLKGRVACRTQRAHAGRGESLLHCLKCLLAIRVLLLLLNPTNITPSNAANFTLVDERHWEVGVAQHSAAAHRCRVHTGQRDICAVARTRQRGWLAVNLNGPASVVGGKRLMWSRW